jgi:hypothetical protein
VAGIGSSYLAGFFIGWVSRRFLKMAALISGGLLACIAVLEETGWIDLDWTSVETQTRHAIAAVHRGLKNSNTSSRGISHQRGQQRLDVLQISEKIARQSQTQGLLTRKITRSPSPLHTPIISVHSEARVLSGEPVR